MFQEDRQREVRKIFERLLSLRLSDSYRHRQTHHSPGPDLKTLLTGKFKASAIEESQCELFQRYINRCVTEDAPIQFTIPTGGYKKWQLPSASRANWAEFFNLIFMKDLALRILQHHRPGVRIVYLSCDLAMTELKVNNIPLELIDEYHVSFQSTIDYFNDLCNEKHILFQLVRLSDVVDRDIFMGAYAEDVVQAAAFWSDSGNRSRVAEMEKRAARNYYCTNGGPAAADIRKSAQSTWAFHKAFFRLNLTDPAVQIPIAYHRGFDNVLHLRSYGNSVVQFWVGEGVIVSDGTRMYPSILSYEKLQQCQMIETIPMDRFAFLGENYKTIPVVHKV